MTVVHRVTGYSKATERLEREWSVPPRFVKEARRLAEAPANLLYGPGAFPLTEAAVRKMARMLNFQMDVDRFDWFLEPIEA